MTRQAKWAAGSMSTELLKCSHAYHVPIPSGFLLGQGMCPLKDVIDLNNRQPTSIKHVQANNLLYSFTEILQCGHVPLLVLHLCLLSKSFLLSLPT